MSPDRCIRPADLKPGDRVVAYGQVCEVVGEPVLMGWGYEVPLSIAGEVKTDWFDYADDLPRAAA